MDHLSRDKCYIGSNKYPSSISIQFKNPIPVIPQFQGIIQCGCQNIFAIWGKFYKTEKNVEFGLVWFWVGFGLT